MRHYFIINPVAGKKRNADEMVQTVHRIFSERQDEYEIHLTEYPDHATELAAQAASTGESTRIYCVGGDGTLHEVVTGCYQASGAASSRGAAVTTFTGRSRRPRRL